VWNRLGVLLAPALTKALGLAATIASNHARIAAIAAQLRVTRGKRPGA